MLLPSGPPGPPKDCPLGPAAGKPDASFASTGIADHTAEVSSSASRPRQSTGARTRAEVESRCIELFWRRGIKRAANRITAASAQGMAISGISHVPQDGLLTIM